MTPEQRNFKLTALLQPALLAAELERFNIMDRQAIRRAFLSTLGQDSEAAYQAAIDMFFALQSFSAGDILKQLMETNLLSARQEAAILCRMWMASQVQFLEIEDPQAFIVPHFRKARDAAPVDLMGERDWREFYYLPEELTIYRGCRSRRADRNPSWTDSKEIARVFSAGKDGEDTGQILAAEISKADVLATFFIFYDDALEIMVDPAGLRNVRVVEDNIRFVGWREAVDAYYRERRAGPPGKALRAESDNSGIVRFLIT